MGLRFSRDEMVDAVTRFVIHRTDMDSAGLVGEGEIDDCLAFVIEPSIHLDFTDLMPVDFLWLGQRGVSPDYKRLTHLRILVRHEHLQ